MFENGDCRIPNRISLISERYKEVNPAFTERFGSNDKAMHCHLDMLSKINVMTIRGNNTRFCLNSSSDDSI